MDQISHHDDIDDIDDVKREIDTLRERTESVAMALENRLFARKRQLSDVVDRVKRLGDVRARLREHPMAAGSSGAVTLLAAGLVGYAVYRRWRREHSLRGRVTRRAHAYRQLLADPERALHPREPLGKRLVRAILVVTATTVTQALLKSLLDNARPQPARNVK